ncbi:lipocalin family protein [Microbacterium sp. A94]|uniref:lipocalin family protein n=1 Tax=Microbacterium sp. A94 TaxID=3450717 RepID=UPI003F424993
MTDHEARSVDVFDLQRYLGLWYELGRLPLRYEDDKATDVTAEYSLNDDGTVKVDNRCRDEQGEPTQALGLAIPDEDHPGRLEVTFLPEGLRWIPFTKADYWVLKIDSDYRYALVGTPDHKYLWLLGREPQTDAATRAEYLEEARLQGYEVKNWIEAGQSGHRVEI